MKHFLRPYRTRFEIAELVCWGLRCRVRGRRPSLCAERMQWRSPLSSEVMQEPTRCSHSSSQGYMGVLVGDVDTDTAADAETERGSRRGGHADRPRCAGGASWRSASTTWCLQLNGQNVEGAEQFSRMMREIPAGHKVSLVISRDGASRLWRCNWRIARMEHDVWNKLDNGGESFGSRPGMGILSGGGGDAPLPGGFHMPFLRQHAECGRDG